MASKAKVDREFLASLIANESKKFCERCPRSAALFEAGKHSLLEGVPMNWMVRWPGPFPVYVDAARGSHFTDVDGHEYIDFCLGDTGAMAGHSPPPTVEAIRRQADRGLTLMLPTEDAAWVGEELSRRFGVGSWQFALTATDANRFALRLARAVTGRPKILVFNWCYHGSVDETIATLDGVSVRPRFGNMGPPIDPAITTRVVEFNDLAALERELAHGDVACVLCEPALTNIGIVHPEPGFHAALRRLAAAAGALLIIDETHTICSGPGGYTRANALKPDMVTIGKPIAGGIPAAAYGFSPWVADRVLKLRSKDASDTGGIGGTLAGNAMSLAAMRATLGEVLTDAAFDRMIDLATLFTRGVQETIDALRVPWHVTQLGCRAEYWFRDAPPRNGHQAAAAVDPDLDVYMHLAALNRGILMTPFHNMALMSPSTDKQDVARHNDVFREITEALFA